MYYFEIWRFPDLIEDNRNKTFIKTLADFFAKKIRQSPEFLIQNSILILTRSRQNRNALQMLMLFQSVTRYFSSHDNMTISISSLISFFLFAVYSEQRNTNEVTLPWSLLYYGVFILNIHERRIFLKSAGEEISHPKPVTDKNKNFMTQLVLSEILHCKV